MYATAQLLNTNYKELLLLSSLKGETLKCVHRTFVLPLHIPVTEAYLPLVP